MVSRVLNLCITLILALAASLSSAQTDPTSVIGIPEHAHTLPVRFGFVNLDNGNLHLEIPLYSSPERGHPSLQNILVYDSVSWTANDGTGQPQDQPVSGWGGGIGYSDLPPNALPGPPYEVIPCSQFYGSIVIGNVTISTSFTATDSHGTTHFFNTAEIADAVCYYAPGQPNQGAPYPDDGDAVFNSYPQTGTYYASDGSGYRLTITKNGAVQNLFLAAPNGIGQNSHTGNATPNGNLYDNGYQVKDELGEAYPTTTGAVNVVYAGTLGGGNSHPYQAKPLVPGTLTRSGESSSYTFSWEYIPVCSGTGQSDYCGGMWTLGSVTLPDEGTYSFSYDQGTSPTHYGRLTGITLPTGGTIAYGYATNNCGVLSGTPFCSQVNSVTDNGGTTTLMYSAPTVLYGFGSGGTAQYPSTLQVDYPVTVMLPPHVVTAGSPGTVQDKTVYSAANFSFVKTDYSGSATVLRTTTTTTDNYGRAKAIKSVWATTGESHEVDFKYADDSSLSGTRVYGQLGIDMIALETEYNSGTLVRSLRTLYQQDTSTNQYVSQFNMINYPASVSLMDATGATVSQTQYTYDEYSASYCSQHYPKGLSGIPMLTSITGAAGHDDADYGVSYTARGNPTTISYTGKSVVNPITIHKCYDTLGNVTQSIDGNGNATRYSYADNFYESSCITPGEPTYAFPTTVTDVLGHSTTTSYYSCIRAPEAVRDPNDIANGRAGTTYQYDSAFRPTCTNYPDGGQTCASYPSPTETDIATKMNSSTTDTVQHIADSFGRGTTVIDDGSQIQSDTSYDVFNRVNSVSNPHRVSGSSPSDGTTYYAYDALGRQTNIKKPDGNTRSWSYSGNTTTSTDEAGNLHISQTDSLGRLQMVKEPNGTSASATMETDYSSYDVLNNLQTVTQWGGPSGSTGARTRTFTYDGLSHLLTASNPESGTTTYTYDANGNVSTKKDARGVIISYTYEPLNRINWKHYSDGSTVAAGFGYDGNDATGNPISPAVTNAIGRLSQYSIVATSAISNFSYDPMGRISQRAGCVPGDCNYDINVIATYDLAGNMTSLTNGSRSHPITWTYAYNAPGQLQTITSSVSADSITTLFKATSTSPASYGPVGLTYGLLGINSSTNQQTSSVTRTYDNLTRLVSETDQNSGGTVQYSYIASAFSANENPTQINDTVMGNNGFTYDTLSRLVTGSGFSGLNGCWSYDAFGNRTAEVFQSSACPSSGLTATAAYNTNNQVSWTAAAPAGFSYDAAGDVLSDGLNNYLYDGEGRLCAVKNSVGTLIGYIYDSGGNRVGEGSLTSLSCNHSSNGFVATKGFVTGFSGEQLTEISGSNVWQHSNVVVGGQLLATYTGSDIYFALNDRLGTKRAEVSGAGCVTTYSSRPFGGNPIPSGNCTVDATEHHFTGKERDAESGNDYFVARYYASAMGRFLSPDPSQLTYADPSNPQSLNLYSYVQNNPLSNVDPLGLDCAHVNGDGDLTGEITPGDCATDTNGNPTNNDIYINATGVTGATLDNNGNLASYSTSEGFSYWANGTQLPSDSVQVTAQDPGVVGALPLETPQRTQQIDPIKLLAVGITADSQHAFGCIAQAFGVGALSEPLRYMGQPYGGLQNFINRKGTGLKPFVSDDTVDTSIISDYLSSKLGKPGGVRFPSFTGGLGTGKGLGFKATPKVGRALGRLAPFLGWAGDIYATVQLGRCL